MDIMIYSFNLNISPKTSYGIHESYICYDNESFCNNKGALFEPDPVE